ncbi:unnamed protein product [Closterium sp. NIES-54]
MYITLYIVTRLPDSLRAVRDHFLTLDPTYLTVDLLEKHLLAAETSVVAVGAAGGTPRIPFFEGCSPSPLAPSFAFAAAVDILGTEDVGTASALSGKRRSSKGKGGKGGSGSGGGGGGGSGGGGGGGGGGSGGSGGGGGGAGVSASPPALACPALPSLRRGVAARRSSLLIISLTSAPQQTLHIDMWNPASVSGQRRESYFLLSVSSSASDSKRTFLSSVCTLTEVLNLWPRVSLPETSPTLRWTGKVGDASVFRVWGSRAFVHDTFADKLSSCAIPCVFLGFPLDTLGWQFFHPTSCHVLPSQDVTFDESIPFYCLFPYCTAPLPPPPLFLGPGPPPIDPLPPQGPALSGVSPVDPLPGTLPVEVAVDSGAARGAASGGAEPASAEPGGAEPEGAEPGGAESEGAESRAAEPEGAEPGGAESECAESGGAEPRGNASARGPAGASPRLSPRREPLSPQQMREWFAQHTRLRSGVAGAGGSAAGGTQAGGAGATSPGGAGVTGRAGGTVGAGGAGPGGARTRGTKAAGAGCVAGAGAGDPRAGEPGAKAPGAGGAGAGGAGARDPGAGGVGAGGGGTSPGGTGAGDSGAGGTGAGGAEAGAHPGAGGSGAGGAGASGPGVGGIVQERPFFVPSPPSSLPPLDSVLCQPESPLPAPSPYAEQTDSLTERREPGSCPASPVRAVCTGRSVPRLRPPPDPGTHIMALRPSSVPLRVPLLSPPLSSLPDVPDHESDLARAAIPTVLRLLATVVTDPSFESTVASALVAELVDFAAACRLEYATILVAESESIYPPSVGAMLLAPEGDPDAPDIPTLCSYAEAITGPYSSQWQTAMDAEMASWKSTATYVDAVPPSAGNIVDGMWIFRVKRPPGSPPDFKARYVARGFSQRQGVDFFHTFSPTPKMMSEE